MTRRRRAYPPIVLKDLRGIRRRPPVWWGETCVCGRPMLVDADATRNGKRAVIAFCVNPKCTSRTKVLSDQ